MVGPHQWQTRLLRESDSHIDFRNNAEIDEQTPKTPPHRTLHLQRTVQIVAGNFLRREQHFPNSQVFFSLIFHWTCLSHSIHFPHLFLNILNCPYGSFESNMQPVRQILPGSCISSFVQGRPAAAAPIRKSRAIYHEAPTRPRAPSQSPRTLALKCCQRLRPATQLKPIFINSRQADASDQRKGTKGWRYKSTALRT